MISFNTIPVNILTPGRHVEFDNTKAVQGTPAMPHRILVVGQRLTSGTVQALNRVQILDPAQGDKYFGRGSMLAQTLRALKAANRWTECWAVALDDLAAGAAATGTIAVTGTALESGTLNLLIGGKNVRVGVAAGDTHTAVATAIAAEVNAEADLPVTATASTGTVTLTARHKGAEHNNVDIRFNYYFGEKTPTGVAVTVTAMSGGTGNPDVADALAALGDIQYHTVVMPFADAANLSAVEDWLLERWGGMSQIEGQAFTCFSGTHSAVSTLGDARNSPFLCAMGKQGSPSLPWEIAAVVAGVDAYEPDPARPRQTLHMPGILAPAAEARYTREERNLHLADGVATFTVDDGGRCRVERLVTTYKTNDVGAVDPSYRDVETLRTLAYFRYSVNTRIALRYPRMKLGQDGTRYGPGQAIVTPSVVRDELIVLFREWESAGLAEDFEQFKADLLVEIDQNDPNRINAVIPPNCINQFRVFAGRVEFRL